jgi:thioredoxin reductase (NADPH)
MADYDVLVAGDGVAGLTAALFSARYGHATAVLGGKPGGSLLSVNTIDDFPGFPGGVAGYDLGPGLQEQALNAGAAFKMTEIETLSRAGEEWQAATDGGLISARVVIAATGRRPRRLGVPGEDRLIGHGISDCASCDGPLHRGGVVGVVGGGDSALLETLELIEFVEQVVVLHRGTAFTGQKAYQDRVTASPKVALRFETEVVEVLGDERVAGVRVRNMRDDQVDELELSGLFVYIGGIPQTEFLGGLVDLDEFGCVATDAWMRTTVPGLLAVGSIRRDSSQQAVSAAGDGATAAVAAHRFLTGVPGAAVAEASGAAAA